MSASSKTKLSTKGQVILPKDVRVARGLKPGAVFTVESRPEGILLKPEKPFPPKTLDEVCGMLKYDGPPVSIEDMKLGPLEIAREKYARR
jgi:AbrB family looped-hinge helix DNA binding protein